MPLIPDGPRSSAIKRETDIRGPSSGRAAWRSRRRAATWSGSVPFHGRQKPKPARHARETASGGAVSCHATGNVIHSSRSLTA